jgi:RNA polymerase sigma-70 factor (ECF subfamily)
MARAPSHAPDVERWLREESTGLRRLARSLLRSDADADDCVQDAWLAALRAPPASAPRSWLRTVVRHLAFRRGRDAGRRVRREAVAARGEGTPSVADTAARLEIRRRVLDAVASLEEPYRTTLTLRYFDGLSPTGIASRQGVPVKTVKTRLSRGLARLRAALDESHGGRRATWTHALAIAIAGRTALAAAAGGATVLGGLVAVKKSIALALLLLLLVGAGVATWTALDRPPTETPTETADGPSLPTAPTLTGARPERPARETAPAPSSVLREGDVVPEATFAGRVVDEAGRGVPGASVSLVWHSVRMGSGEAVNATHLILRRERERREAPAATTGAEGYFRFDRPYGSASFLRAAAAGFVDTVSGLAQSGTFATIRLSREGALRVRALSEDGKPVEGAEARLVSAHLSGKVQVGPRQVFATAKTDAAGRARLPAAPGAWLRLEVVPLEPDLGLVEQALSPTSEEVEVRLPRVTVAERRIVDAETGAALPTAWVDLQRGFDWGSYEHEGFRRRVFADRDGVVRLPHQEGYTGGYASAPGYEASFAWHDPVRLSRAMTVEGVVVTAEGVPLPGAAILVAIPDTVVFEEAYLGRSPVAAWSDEAGRFSLEVRLPHAVSGEDPPDRGVRSLLALHPAHVAAVVDGIAVEPGRRRTVTLRCPRPATLAFEVVDAASKPLADVGIGVSRLIPRGPTWPVPAGTPWGVDTVNLERSRHLRTDAGGRCEAGGLPPGPHVVHVGMQAVEVDLVEGERRPLRIVRGAGPSIRGRVVTSKGDPVAGVRVDLFGPAASVQTSAADGSFAFLDVKPGEYGVGVSYPVEERGPPQGFHVSARPGDQVLLRVPSGPARVRIVVEGPPEGTAEFSLVTVPGGYVPAGTGFAPMPTSPFETAGFTPGTGLVVVRAKGYGWTAVRFEAPEATTTEVRVALRPAGTVDVRLPPAAIRKGAYARLHRSDGFPGPLVAGDRRLLYGIQRCKGDVDEFGFAAVDGVFRLPDVPPGRYDVSYGRYDGSAWVSLAASTVEVRSGATTEVSLAP